MGSGGHNFIDLTGQKFGRLKVLKRVENDKYNNAHYLCVCEYDGKEITVNGRSLRSGNTRSCGCIRREMIIKNNKENRKYNTYDLSGEYGIGYTTKGEEFYFDLEDYEKIKNYCWHIDGGYLRVDLDRVNYIFMHRLVMNCPDNMEVDHIYHNKNDNRKEFLRLVTESQNCMNRGMHKNNTSGVTGVCWYTKYEKWLAFLRINRKQINLGYYDDFNEAVEVRKQAELKYFGEYRYMGNDYQEGTNTINE